MATQNLCVVFDVLVLGFANLVADGISMGFGDFVSSNTERDVTVKELLVTEWEVTNLRRRQEQALVDRYLALDMNINDETTVVSIFSKYEDIMVDEKMVQNEVLTPDNGGKPWKRGLITFGAFLVVCVFVRAFTRISWIREGEDRGSELRVISLRDLVQWCTCGFYSLYDWMGA